MEAAPKAATSLEGGAVVLEACKLSRSPAISRLMAFSASVEAVAQVWSLTQFYSVDFPQSRIGVKKGVFNKLTFKVLRQCFLNTVLGHLHLVRHT